MKCNLCGYPRIKFIDSTGLSRKERRGLSVGQRSQRGILWRDRIKDDLLFCRDCFKIGVA